MSEVGRTRLFANGPAAFCQNENFVTRNIKFLQSFADDFFGDTVTVGVGGVPGIETTIISCFEEFQCLPLVSTRLD